MKILHILRDGPEENAGIIIDDQKRSMRSKL